MSHPPKINVGKGLRWLHRYVGLAIAIFIILAALTGSLLAFMPELERLTAPHLYSSKSETPLLTISEYAEAVEQLDERFAVTSVSFQDLGRVRVGVKGKINPATGEAFNLQYSEILLDPSDASLLGMRNFGVISEGWHNIMPFTYLLHYSLILGDIGWWFMGIIALIWTIDCINGLLITFPSRTKHTGPRPSFWHRWSKAWKIKFNASPARINFDIHRALSLWLWLVLLVFAWSSVYMNLWGSFYLHATRAVTEFHPPWYHLAQREKSPRLPVLSWRQAEAHANVALQKLVKDNNIQVHHPNALSYVSSYASYRYRVYSDRDLSSLHVRTEIYIDAYTGQTIFTYLPTGQYTGNTISSWLHTLHRARIWGLSFQAFIALLGIAIVLISVSGILIWWKKTFRGRKSAVK